MSDQKKAKEADAPSIELGDRSQKTTPEQDIPTTRADVDGEKTDGFKETKRTGYGNS
ncbi:hypothetical protein Poly30_09010 [Planctomycetes bacterium Poly30]|uniref:Uncharacterized protein n=1 Tax=Saltatorellus ferox TaxID=2528018 RepID=A0A518EMT8_9BACT|nr:hypothetical protein Poly30_09010 [Planctomycetes bacterium Poly30]